MELWGGVECAFVHTDRCTVDQLVLTGHDSRPADLQLLADLGLDAVRYPLLRDRIWPSDAAAPDWSWPDERLGTLKRLGIRPVVTLLHHGTRHGQSDLRSEQFADELARFAGRAAARYPWLSEWTPVNEPLTSARFSCLYGHWYPHQQDDNAFLLAIAAQVRATILCMQRIRMVNPAARLIHCEDLGYTHSTDELRYQAEYENERRWLGLDLLCGRVSPGHPFHDPFLAAGFSERELDWFIANASPPDLQGCNHYPTSERYLSGEVSEFPAWSHGGNGTDAYADVHLQLAPGIRPRGVRRLLQDAWERYGIPLALTEVHLHAAQDAQIRWFEEAWHTALELDRNGVPVQAVCSWALFGSYDWNTLLTDLNGHYEPGAFDVSSGLPVATPLARHLRQLDQRRARHSQVLRS